jgi:PIN domain
MRERVLFIDLENVQTVDVSKVPADVRVLIFCGTTQNKLPRTLVKQTQPLGSRVDWVEVSGQGPNALDFHIAFYVGQQLAQKPTSVCVILSRDTGFDPLMRHVQAIGRACRRVTSLEAAFPAEPRAELDPFARLLMLLRKEKARPAKRRGLAGKVKSWFPELSEDARGALVQRLFDEARVRESGTVLTYEL